MRICFVSRPLPTGGTLASFKALHALIWTTTPWTLVSNLAVALNPKFNYAILKHEGAHFIVAEQLVSAVL